MLLRILKKFKNIISKKRKKRIRQTIKVEQNYKQIQVSGFLSNENYEVLQLWLNSRFTDCEYQIDSEVNSNQFKFNVDLTEMRELLNADEDIYDLFLFVRVRKENFSEARIAK